MTIKEAIAAYEPIAAPLIHHGWRVWCKQLEQDWSEKRLAEITVGDINSLVAAMRRGGKSEATIYAKLSTLKRLYAAARSQGCKVYYPEEVTRLKINKEKVVSLSPAQASRLQAALHPEDWLICDLARETGMRGIELWMATWSDVDLHNGFITVREQVERGVRRQTKSGSTRRVGITKRCRVILKKLQELSKGKYILNPKRFGAWKCREAAMNGWKREVRRRRRQVAPQAPQV